MPPVLLKHKSGWRLRRLRSGIHVSGRWPTNLYHWVIEILPKIHLALRLPQEFRHFPLIVPSSVMGVPQLVESLELFRWPGGLEVLPDGDYANVDRLVVMDGLPSLYRAGDRELTILHVEAARTFVKDLIDRVGVEPTERERQLLYLTRPRGSRRRFNRTVVSRTLRRRGFEEIEPSILSFADQVRAARGSRVIVGPGGAAMTNLIFAEGAETVIWSTRHTRDEGRNIWMNLMAVGGNRFQFLDFRNAPFQRDSMNLLPYWVSPRRLGAAVDEAVDRTSAHPSS